MSAQTCSRGSGPTLISARCGSVIMRPGGQRPGLRPHTVDLYSWLLRRYIAPQLGAVPLGKLSTPMIRDWRAGLPGDGVSLSMAGPPPGG